MNKIPLNALDANTIVPTATVPTATVPTATVPTATLTGLNGKYEKLKKAYPETIKLRVKPGTAVALKQKAGERGFTSISDLIRAAVLYALRNPDFTKNWMK